MASQNLFLATGNLGADIELKVLPDGKAVANFSLALGKKYKDKNSGEIKEITTWANFVCFDKRAETLAEYTSKGSKLRIEAEYRTRKWVTDTGENRYNHEFIVRDFEFLDSKGTGTAKEQSQSNAYQQQSGDSQQQEQPPIDAYDDVADF